MKQVRTKMPQVALLLPTAVKTCREQNALCDWLRVLPKPSAILVANDVRARQVLDSCIKAGLAVPQEIAVLGVDNDEMSQIAERLNEIIGAQSAAGYRR